VDPIGFGLEKFDAIGQRREKLKLTFNQQFGEGERRADRKVNTVELDLDTTGQVAGLPDSAFSSPKELGRSWRQARNARSASSNSTSGMWRDARKRPAIGRCSGVCWQTSAGPTSSSRK